MKTENASTSTRLEPIVSTLFDLRPDSQVFVVHQRPRHSDQQERSGLMSVSRVGRKYGYIEMYRREERFDLTTGCSVHGDCNARANGYGFDVYVSEDEYRRKQRADSERQRLQDRLVDRFGQLKRDISDGAVSAINAILDEC